MGRPVRSPQRCAIKSSTGAVVILLIGLWLSSKAHLLVVTAAFRREAEELLRQPRALPSLTVTVLAVLSQFGIPTTSLVATEHEA